MRGFAAPLCSTPVSTPQKKSPKKLCAFWGFISVPVVGGSRGLLKSPLESFVRGFAAPPCSTPVPMPQKKSPKKLCAFWGLYQCRWWTVSRGLQKSPPETFVRGLAAPPWSTPVPMPQKKSPKKLCAFWGFISVPVVGVEPTRCHHQRILSPSRLPIPTHRLICCLYSILQAPRKIKIYFVLIFAPPGMQYCLYYTGYNKISGVTILKRFFHMAQLCLCRAGKPQGTVSDPFGLQKMKRTTSILLPIP